MMKPELFMQDIHETMQKGAGPVPVLAQFLKDFAPRCLPDEMVEILLPEDDSPHVPEDDSPHAEFFEPPAEEEMTPLEEDAAVEMLPVDLDAVRQEAFHQGEEKQRAEMQAEFSARIKEIEEVHAAEINELRKNVFNNLSVRVEEGLRKIETGLMRQVTDILAAFVGERLTDEAVGIFAERIAAAGIAAEKPLIVEGDRRFLEVFQSRPDFDPSQYILKPTDDCEIRIVNGDTVLSTRLAPLLGELRELV